MRLKLAFCGVVLVGSIGVGSAGVQAHTDLNYSLPTDGATVGQVVSEITVAFTEPVTLVGNGFEVLDPQGNVLHPFAVTDDDMVFRLQIDPPIGGGQAAVKYDVTPADGHLVSGSFVFTIAADPPVVTEPPATAPTTTAPTTTPPTTTLTPSTLGPVATTIDDATIGTVPFDDVTTPNESDNGVFIVIAGALVLGVLGFLFIRSRSIDSS